MHFTEGKLAGVLTLCEKLTYEPENDGPFPSATGSFIVWVAVPPKETNPSTCSFVGKQTVYASKDIPSAPFTIQVDIPITPKLGTKRLEPIKISCGLFVNVAITGVEQACLFGELLEYGGMIS